MAMPQIPDHVTRRGNRRQAVFCSDEDRQVYLRLLREQATRHGLEVLVSV